MPRRNSAAIRDQSPKRASTPKVEARKADRRRRTGNSGGDETPILRQDLPDGWIQHDNPNQNLTY